jgi:excisionase family DNA binding protein
MFLLVTDLRGAEKGFMEWRGRIGLADEVTLGEAAELLGLAPSHVQVLVENGELPARSNCSVIRISLVDLEIYRNRTVSAAV